MDWEIIIETIKEERCILFLGPEIFTTSAGLGLDQQLIDYFDLNEDLGYKYYNDGLFYFESGEKKTNAYYKLKRFYRQSFPEAEEIFTRIAHIPFHFIISLTPDNKIQEVFQKENYHFKSSFYFRRQPAEQDVKVPSKSMPLLYKILGNIDNQNSLVLTHDDLFDYFESILQEKSMPLNLKHHIKTSRNLIFLGVPFDRWYLQLLLRVLQFHKDEEFIKYAANLQLTPETKSIYKDQFHINFITENINGFLDELYSRCEDEGILREPVSNENEKSPIQRVKKLIAKAEMESAFELFEDYLEDLGETVDHLMDELMILKGRNSRLMKRIREGILDSQDIQITQNKISKDLFNLVKEAQAY